MSLGFVKQKPSSILKPNNIYFSRSFCEPEFTWNIWKGIILGSLIMKIAGFVPGVKHVQKRDVECTVEWRVGGKPSVWGLEGIFYQVRLAVMCLFFLPPHSVWLGLLPQRLTPEWFTTDLSASSPLTNLFSLSCEFSYECSCYLLCSFHKSLWWHKLRLQGLVFCFPWNIMSHLVHWHLSVVHMSSTVAPYCLQSTDYSCGKLVGT